MRVTLSMFKADVGSQGGHTKPSEAMQRCAGEKVVQAKLDERVLDGFYSFTGDDNFFLYSHLLGPNCSDMHDYARHTLEAMTDIASEEGQYGAGQDLNEDAPAGNVRGSGIACMEMEFDLNSAKGSFRPAEAFLVFQADKCGPGGAYNMPLYSMFCDPMENPGLLIKPELNRGFIFEIIDMDYKDSPDDRMISLQSPEESWDIAALLLDHNRYAVKRILSRHIDGEPAGAGSAERLHNIFKKYTGKDDPLLVLRTQGIFPPPEACVGPFRKAHYLEGGMMGSLTMALMPVGLNKAVAGAFCQPLVSCYAASMNERGKFSHTIIDLFGQQEWDETRQLALRKSRAIRDQGCFGVGMAPQQELAYTGITKIRERLDGRYKLFPLPGAKQR